MRCRSNVRATEFIWALEIASTVSSSGGVPTQIEKLRVFPSRWLPQATAKRNRQKQHLRWDKAKSRWGSKKRQAPALSFSRLFQVISHKKQPEWARISRRHAAVVNPQHIKPSNRQNGEICHSFLYPLLIRIWNLQIGVYRF